MKKIFFSIFLSVMAVAANAQITTPQPSPAAELHQTIGLSKAVVEYSRPSMKGRQVFGGLVPFGELWRLGANASTKITFDQDVQLAGKAVAKGKYALYAIPQKDKWTIVVHKNLTHWGTGYGKNRYDQAEDLVRFDVPTQETKTTWESFTIEFNNFKPTGATLDILWENTMVSIPVTVETDKAVEASIAKAFDPKSKANDYFSAARYYFETEKDLSKAENWINEAVKLRTDAYWYFNLQAKILAKNGKNKEAKKAAKTSLQLAQSAGNSDYVKMNEALIKTL
ncbi:DUF2911 domain-containing protein [Persicobacter psychrovividus]|uniref:DUF2911 domain-containing protein n=1 Tax=Persicobacter psychrovividus TaxID=387638 RepID=A0ABN6LEI6_9BACT|nr:hypothetical protein PEPS_38700 [Persicobacter psychrovividus]